MAQQGLIVNDSQDLLFSPYTLGDLRLPNRFVMSPLTRSRAKQPGDIPWDLNVEYYRQRAGAGLIIAEATHVSPQGKGYAYTPGIYTQEQVDGWRRVTEAVHQAGGRIVLQLWHVGRISHPLLQPGGRLPVAPSALRPRGVQAFLGAEHGMQDIPTPRPLDADELPWVVEQFRHGAENAKDAGFDGVEIHGANGYLIDQFLRSGSNQRTDEYGGSVENRLRFPLMVVDAVLEVWGTERTGIRVSPVGEVHDMHDDDPVATFAAFARELGQRKLAYIEVVEQPEPGAPRHEAVIEAIRSNFPRGYIANSGYSVEEARQRLADGRCDLVSFGKPFISNPDFVERVRQGAPMNDWDSSTFYGGDAKGYTDYPSLA